MLCGTGLLYLPHAKYINTKVFRLHHALASLRRSELNWNTGILCLFVKSFFSRHVQQGDVRHKGCVDCSHALLSRSTVSKCLFPASVFPSSSLSSHQSVLGELPEYRRLACRATRECVSLDSTAMPIFVARSGDFQIPILKAHLPSLDYLLAELLCHRRESGQLTFACPDVRRMRS